MFRKHPFLIAEKEYAISEKFTAIGEGVIFKDYNVTNTSYQYAQEYGNGAILAVGRRFKTIQYRIEVGAATNVMVSIETKVHPEMPFIQVIERTYTTDTDFSITVSENAHEFRVGVKATGSPNAATKAWVGYKIQN